MARLNRKIGENVKGLLGDNKNRRQRDEMDDLPYPGTGSAI